MQYLYDRYRELQAYVGWSEEDTRRVHALAAILEPAFAALIDDFYDEIERHPEARNVIKGGQAQIVRLKGTLITWLRDLVTSEYDAAYVQRRWQVGRRHVEIGLDQVFTNAALSRLRTGMCQAIEATWQGEPGDLVASVRSLDKLLDLDLAIIEDAYQEENLLRVRRRSEATFRSLVEAAPCVIVILRRNHSICYFSPGAEEITGYSKADVLGEDYFPIFLPQEHQAPVAASIEQVFSKKPVRGYENPIVCKDGTQRWMMWNAEFLPEHEGEPALLAVGQDLTTFKETQERAVQAERLAAIGQMVTGLAHESGNALARSEACLEMLSLEVEENSEALELIQRIQQAQDHLQQLYDDVRGYAAPIKLDREEWDVAGIWRQAWRNLDVQRTGRNVTFREHAGDFDLSCMVDNFRLEQVFRNIFENALAACGDPVEIRIVCAETTLSRKPALQIAVCDNGPGLNAKQQQKIFDPFFTTKSKGTGLGMAIAKRIIDAHNGHLSVRPGAGKGAEIVVTLPRDES